MKGKRRIVAVPEKASDLIEYAKGLYGIGSFSVLIVDALALYVQFGEEWKKGNEVVIRDRKTGTEFSIMKPRTMVYSKNGREQ